MGLLFEVPPKTIMLIYVLLYSVYRDDLLFCVVRQHAFYVNLGIIKMLDITNKKWVIFQQSTGFVVFFSWTDAC